MQLVKPTVMPCMMPCCTPICMGTCRACTHAENLSCHTSCLLLVITGQTSKFLQHHQQGGPCGAGQRWPQDTHLASTLELQPQWRQCSNLCPTHGHQHDEDQGLRGKETVEKLWNATSPGGPEQHVSCRKYRTDCRAQQLPSWKCR